jgi:hypothetical protein
MSWLRLIMCSHDPHFSLHSLPSTEKNIPMDGMRLYVSQSLQQLRLLLIVQYAGISAGITIYTNTGLGSIVTVI